jgi:hypothetical protein
VKLTRFNKIHKGLSKDRKYSIENIYIQTYVYYRNMSYICIDLSFPVRIYGFKKSMSYAIVFLPGKRDKKWEARSQFLFLAWHRTSSESSLFPALAGRYNHSPLY